MITEHIEGWSLNEAQRWPMNLSRGLEIYASRLHPLKEVVLCEVPVQVFFIVNRQLLTAIHLPLIKTIPINKKEHLASGCSFLFYLCRHNLIV
jgi:hypothetical protein